MRFRRIIISIAALCALSVPLHAVSVTLNWTAVTTNADGSPISDLGTYTVYQSTTDFSRGGVFITTTAATADSSIQKIAVAASANSVIVNSLSAAKTYYFRLTASDLSGNQSGFNLDSSANDVEVSTLTAAAPPPNNPPTVATLAAANPSPVVSSTTILTVLGADDGGEGNLTYSWAPVTGVSFSVNNSNAAKTTKATFTQAGTYSFTVTITDAGNLTATSSVNVTVSKTLTTIAVSPSAANVQVSMTRQFTATALDQFGTAISPAPTFTWSVPVAAGAINTSGLFTAASTPGGPYNLTAVVGSTTSVPAIVTLTASTPPTVNLTTPVNGAVFIAPATINLAATVTAGTNPISKVQFFHDGISLATDLTSPYSFNWTGVAAGTYQISAVVTDNQGILNTSNIANITVNPAVVVIPAPTLTIPSPLLVNGQITASVPAGFTISRYQWTLTTVPGGLSTSASTTTGVLNLGTLSLSPGTYQLSVTATDSGGNVSPSSQASVTLVASGSGTGTPPPVPTLSLPAFLPINAQITAKYTGTVSAASFDWTFTPISSIPNAVFQASMHSGNPGSPSGLRASAPAGAITFPTPGAQANLAAVPLILGLYQVTVTVMDANGLSSTSAPSYTTLVASDLAGVVVYPNPWRSNKHSGINIQFTGLTMNTTIKIFTVSGHWVKTLPVSNTSASWDRTNDSGDRVAAGIYLYLITTDQGQKKTGQLVIIK